MVLMVLMVRLAVLIALAGITSAAGRLGRLAAAETQAMSAFSPPVLVGIEGRVDHQAAGSPNWVRARTNQVLQLNDRLRTGPRSRATLKWSETSVQRLDELGQIEIAPPVTTNGPATPEVKAGGIYFFNRSSPGSQHFKTPLASGAILGTEFALRVAPDGTATVDLMEGSIGLTNAFGSLALAAGQQATVLPNAEPRKTASIIAPAAVQWCLYYPAVLNPAELGGSLGTSSRLAESLRLYRTGDVLGAVAALPTEVLSDVSERRFVAAVLLAAGKVEDSESQLTGDDHELADALRLMVASVRGTPGPKVQGGSTTTAMLARSYAAQRAGDLPEARNLAHLAAKHSPDFGFAWARLAEMEFGFGDIPAAAEANRKALELSPAHAAAHALEGFLHAARHQMKSAEADFDRAIALDPGLANGWLGRGLVKFQQGRAREGLDDLQIAAATEPNRALLRSYLGKAWAESGDRTHARSELDRALELDGGDPTAWLYRGLLEQQYNRIQQAVESIEAARENNQNRAVYRSRLLLDQDASMQSINLASVYRDAGLVEISEREAQRAVASDPANASAHQFLADSYYSRRDRRQFNLRYETPWFSELLLAQMLAPVGAGSLSQNISQHEYSRLFARDGSHLTSYTEYRSAGDWIQFGSAFGTYGKLRYALDAEYRSERGFARNTDYENLSLYGRFQYQVRESDSAWVMVNRNDYTSGDIRQLYDPHQAGRSYRSSELQEPNVFAGWHHTWSPGHHTLFLAGRLDGSLQWSDTNAVVPITSRPNPDAAITQYLERPFQLEARKELAAWTAELLQMAALPHGHSLIGGVRFQAGDFDPTFSLRPRGGFGAFPPANLFPPLASTVDGDLLRVSVYLYDMWAVLDNLTLTLGGSYEHLKYPGNTDFAPITRGDRTESQWSPKLGLMWSPRENMHFRAAWTRSLGGASYDNSVRLEPAQVSGFTQAYRSLIPESVAGVVPGTAFETLGVGWDQRFSTKTYLSISAERLTSDADQEFGAFDWARNGRPTAPPQSLIRSLDYQERGISADLTQLFGRYFSAGIRYELRKAELETAYPGLTPPIGSNPARDLSATWHQVTPSARVYLPCGFFTEVLGRWIQQSSTGYTPALGREDFWHVDASVGHRFLRRRLEVRAGVLNLTDADYRLNPLNIREEFFRERTFFASLKWFW